MKKLLIIISINSLLAACHDKDGHPNACFTVSNPVMTLGDTVNISLCGPITRESEWDMGDTIYKSAAIPKHVYKAKGTYTITLLSYEHMGGGKMFTHWQKQAVSEAQQTITVQ
jgi:chitodextrinase